MLKFVCLVSLALGSTPPALAPLDATCDAACVCNIDPGIIAPALDPPDCFDSGTIGITETCDGCCNDPPTCKNDPVPCKCDVLIAARGEGTQECDWEIKIPGGTSYTETTNFLFWFPKDHAAQEVSCGMGATWILKADGEECLRRTITCEHCE